MHFARNFKWDHTAGDPLTPRKRNSNQLPYLPSLGTICIRFGTRWITVSTSTLWQEDHTSSLCEWRTKQGLLPFILSQDFRLPQSLPAKVALWQWNRTRSRTYKRVLQATHDHGRRDSSGESSSRRPGATHFTLLSASCYMTNNSSCALFHTMTINDRHINMLHNTYIYVVICGKWYVFLFIFKQISKL